MLANNIYDDLTSTEPIRNVYPENIYCDLTGAKPTRNLDTGQSHSTKKFICLTKRLTLVGFQYFKKYNTVDVKLK